MRLHRSHGLRRCHALRRRHGLRRLYWLRRSHVLWTHRGLVRSLGCGDPKGCADPKNRRRALVLPAHILAKMGSRIGPVGLGLVNFGRNLANFGQFGGHFTNFGRTRPNCGRTRPIWADLGPMFGSRGNFSTTCRQLSDHCSATFGQRWSSPGSLGVRLRVTSTPGQRRPLQGSRRHECQFDRECAGLLQTLRRLRRCRLRGSQGPRRSGLRRPHGLQRPTYCAAAPWGAVSL